MANIRVDIPATIINGQSVTFRSPVNCSQITGLVVYYPENNDMVNRVFQFADAHGSNVGSVNLFAENVLVKVILDTDLNRAFVQNADTNAYLERRFAEIEERMENLPQGGGSTVTDEHINALIDAKLAELPAVPTYTGEVEVE
jgi:hypothetical protein